MKKVLESQIANQKTPFFDHWRHFEKGEVSRVNQNSLLGNEDKLASDEKKAILVTVLKTIFIFLPGAFFLYFDSIFLLYTFFIDKTSLFDLGFGFVWLTGSALMTVFGIGNIRKAKHFLIPASILAISFTVFMISNILPDSIQTKVLFEYSAYLFPLVLTIPYLTKVLIGKEENQN